ncbi:MAG TPA: GNAT family N-acetyltransferase [Gemmatimonadales bacterium]|nr:GNAT family N-acetyltransferase [Gemmatimonadales bacterium]
MTTRRAGSGKRGRGAARPRPTVREVVSHTDPAVGKVHDLIRRSFPPDELVGRNEWTDSLREREERLWSDSRWHLVVAEHKGAVIGVASGTYLGNINLGVVGYLAVSTRARGLGIGPRVRTRLRTLFKRDAQAIRGGPLEAVIGEVRRDNPWLRALIRSERVLALDFTYFQPQLRPMDRPVPLVLYYEGIATRRQRLATATIRQILYSTWRRIYRVRRPLLHPAFRRMLRDLAGRTTVGEIKARDLPPPVKTPRH